MWKSHLIVALVCICIGTASGFAQDLVINEILYHPSDAAVGAGEDAELLQFIELHNRGTASTDLESWIFTDGITYTFPTGITLDAGEYLIVAKDTAFLQSHADPAIPAEVQVLQWTDGDLDNNGETLTLEDGASTVIDSVTYDDIAPWPTEPDGFGASLELVNPAFDNAYGSVWRASDGLRGTPGIVNSQFSENPIVLSESPARGTVITSLSEVSVTFAEPVQGVVASDLAVNGSIASSVVCATCSGGVGAGPYVFSGFAEPITSPINVALAPGLIQDEDSNGFAGDTWIYAFDPPNIVINELHYNPSGSEDMEEFIELYNAEEDAIDISGWSLQEFSNQGYTFPASTTLAAGAYVVVARSPADLQAATGFVTTHAWDVDDKLANSGEPVSLRNDLGIVVDRVEYSDDAPWPTAPDGDGPSLELLNPMLDNSEPGAWAASLADYGTPGAENSVATDMPLVLSETPQRGTAVEALTEITVVFTTPVTGVAPGDLIVGGSAATSVEPTTGPADVYTFSGFATPTPGSVVVALNSGSIEAGGVPFPGDWWTLSTGLVVVINEVHYHPADPNEDAEFIELVNAGTNTANLANWTFCDGVEYTFPTGTTIAPGEYLVIAFDSTLLESVTGYAGALEWTDGRLSNGGEDLALCDDVGNTLDRLAYDDSSPWPMTPDGDGPSMELLNPAVPNEYGAAWRASAAAHGTPGAQNSVFQASPAPIILGPIHDPPIPAAGQSVLITATVIDDATTPTVTLYYRQDQDPTIAYSSTLMLDDGFHGDGASGDNVYGAIVPGLADGERLDFTIRADDGVGTTAAPAGNDTLVAGEYPSQTFLCKFSDASPATDFPTYHMITTQYTRNSQETIDRTDYDATFIQCGTGGACEIFYNITERYRGHSTLTDTPHGFRLDFSDEHPLASEMGFEITDMILMAQEIDRQHLGYTFFREAFGGSVPTPMTQFVRLNTNPLAHGGVQDWIYVNIERIDDEFLSCQGGSITPARFPDLCSDTGEPCDGPDDCGSGVCVDMTEGNIYRARHTGDLDYRGEDPDDYRATIQPNGGTDYGYDKENNEAEDDWTDLIALSFAVDAATTPDETYEDDLSALIDEDEWVRWFAIHMLLANGEGGLYRDSGDDYFLYFEPAASPNGINAQLIPWDLDSVWGGHWYLDNYWEQPTIWRSGCGHPCNPFKNCPSALADTSGRFVRSNAFAGRFVKAVWDLLENEFTQANVDAMIDAIPEAVLAQSPYYATAEARRTQLKSWAAARRTVVMNEIVSQLTIDNIPASPYSAAQATVTLTGDLDQRGTHDVLVNGEPADQFTVFRNPYPAEPCGFPAEGGNWSKEIVLGPGQNNIVVQCLDESGAEIARVEDTILYEPAPARLHLIAPQRMVEDKTLTLQATMLGADGEVFWRAWNSLGSIWAERVSDGTIVPTTITIFEEYPDGVGGGTPPADSIRFYNGRGSVSLTLDDPDDVAGTLIRVFVSVDGLTASSVVSVLPNEPATFKTLSGTLAGADLTWSSADGVIHLTGNVIVPAGETLTIGAGTLIMVDAGPLEDGTRILLNNSDVIAQGTAASPIFFFPTSGPSAMVLPQGLNEKNNPNAWRGFLMEGTGSSQFSYTILTGAGNGAIEFHPRPPVFYTAEGATHSLTLSDCLFADTPGEIVFTKGMGTYTISRCLFSRVGIGGEFVGTDDYNVVVEDSWFTRIGRAPEENNVDGDMLHLDQVTTSPQIVRRCIFADGGDDVIDHSNGAQPIIEDCILYDARDKAISLYYSGDITMNNCLVFDIPGGIRATGQPVYLTNCTFSRNTMIDNRQCNYSDIDKCIFWPISVVTCCESVNNTLVGTAGHLGCGTCNLSADPLFVDAAANDFNLLPDSPAIDVCGLGRIGWLGFPSATTCSEASACDDGNPCTLDTCHVGVCVHAPMDCSAYADDCNLGVCNEATGLCEAQPLADGTLCRDDTYCNGDESCQTGVCTAGDTRDCDDELSCTTDSCDEVNDVCVHDLDAGACVIDETCYVDDDRNPANDCQVCDSATDTFAWTTLEDGASCDDGLFCNENESCSSGVCTGGSAVDCADTSDCTTDSCNEEEDMCMNDLQPGFCLIDDVCYDEHDLNPGDPAYWCDTVVDPYAWTLRPHEISVDQSYVGCVESSGQTDPYSVVYCSIQDAIDDALAGDTVAVATGTYLEQLRLNKRVIVGSTGACDGGIVIDPNGAGFEGPKSGDDMVYAAVVFESGSGGTILQGLTIQNAAASELSGVAGIEIIDGDIGNVTIQRVCVDGVSGHGFGSYDADVTWPAPTDWLVDDCTFSTDDSAANSGMRPENMHNLTIQSCHIGPAQDCGIVLINASATAGTGATTIEGCQIHNTVHSGLVIGDDCTGRVNISGSELWATNTAAVSDHGDVLLYGQYTPDPQGDPAAIIAINGNTLRDGYNGVCVMSGEDVSTRTVTISGNRILNHANYGAINAGTGLLNAEGNWWGSVEGPQDIDSGTSEVTLSTCESVTVADMLNAEPAGSLGDAVSDNVDYCLWGDCLASEDCDDLNPCTDDACVEYACVFTPDDENSCEDGAWCNGAETCVDGECVSGVSPCGESCEQCDEINDECDWCRFDLDHDTFVGPGDFSFFAGCYGQSYGCDAPEYRTGTLQCCISNFDESSDSFIGPGDFAGFAGCFGSYCDECETCWGMPGSGKAATDKSSPDDGKGSRVSVMIVPVHKLSPADTADAPPQAATSFTVGSTLHAEVWASVTGGERSLAAVHVDVAYDATRMTLESTNNDAWFALFARDGFEGGPTLSQDGVGEIQALGGCALLGEDQLGMSPAWVRVATLSFRVDEAGAGFVRAGYSSNGYGVALLNRFGVLESSELTLSGSHVRLISRRVLESTPKVSSSEEGLREEEAATSRPPSTSSTQ